ncbi:MAG TPA: class I SAM-dependent methyltransferase [Phenylobacterium sp.]|jgi:2-polyprenyl-3-methyl-5-hydroxy-6-metoxy-1,4-benzoquinol methylase
MNYLTGQYSQKEEGYFTTARYDYVSDLADDPQASILELGCGNGATGALALQQGKCAKYVGIEMFEPMALEARQVLSAVHIGNIETMDLPYPPHSFDVLICSEVLEHLTDPIPVVRKLVSLLKPGGTIYASVPNISHWKIVLALIGGRFDYQSEGAMDHTHLRWFTPRTFRRLFEDCGVSVDRLKPLGAKRLTGLVSRMPLTHMLWWRIDLRGHRVQ